MSIYDLTNSTDFNKSQTIMLPKVPRETLLDFCRRMFIIRHFEESLVPLHDKGVFGGHYHLYIGQEATGVPALSCLRGDDYLFTTHRNHGHLLARGADPKRLCAEILGRPDGPKERPHHRLPLWRRRAGGRRRSRSAEPRLPLETARPLSL